MKNKLILGLLAFAAVLSANAQSRSDSVQSIAPSEYNSPKVVYAYFSYNSVLTSMPDYVEAERMLDGLKAKYEAEAKRSADDFNTKYTEFVEGEKTFAPAIRAKRQQELEELIDKNMAFRDESRRLLDSAREEALRPVRQKLQRAIEKVGRDNGFAFIVNTDNNGLPYANPSYTVNVTNIIKEALR